MITGLKKKSNTFGHFTEAVMELSCDKYLYKRIRFPSKIRPDAERILEAKRYNKINCIYLSVLNTAFNS